MGLLRLLLVLLIEILILSILIYPFVELLIESMHWLLLLVIDAIQMLLYVLAWVVPWQFERLLLFGLIKWLWLALILGRSLGLLVLWGDLRALLGWLLLLRNLLRILATLILFIAWLVLNVLRRRLHILTLLRLDLLRFLLSLLFKLLFLHFDFVISLNCLKAIKEVILNCFFLLISIKSFNKLSKFNIFSLNALIK